MLYQMITFIGLENNNMKKTGIQLIAEERKRQIEVEGFTLERDKQYKNDDLLDYAKFLLTGNKVYFPVGWDKTWYEKRFKRSKSDNITKAAALLAAVLDDMNAVTKDNIEWVTFIDKDYSTYPPEGETVLVTDEINYDTAYYLKSSEYKWMKVDILNDDCNIFNQFEIKKWKLIY